jgi:hypothetical protein
MKWSSLEPKDQAAIRRAFPASHVAVCKCDWAYRKLRGKWQWVGKPPEAIKPIKAIKMYSNTAHLDINPMVSDQYLKVYREHPVFVLPATQEAYDQIVEQMASATIYRHRLAGAGWVGDSEAVGKDRAIAALTAIGINRPM